MTRSPPWTRLGFDMIALGVEASSVMALRMMRLGAGGPLAVAEAQLMVAEKVRAAEGHSSPVRRDVGSDGG